MRRAAFIVGLYLFHIHPAAAAGVNATTYLRCSPDYGHDVGAPTGTVSAVSSGATGKSTALASTSGGIYTTSSALGSGLSCGWNAAAGDYTIISVNGLASGQTINANILIPTHVAVTAYSLPNTNDIGQGYVQVEASTLNSKTTYTEILQVQDGLITPYSQITGTLDFVLTPKATFSADGKTQPIPAAVLAAAGIGPFTYRGDSITGLRDFSLTQAEAVSGALRSLSGTFSLAGVKIGVGFDYQAYLDRSLNLAVTLGSSDYVSLFANTDAVGSSSTAGADASGSIGFDSAPSGADTMPTPSSGIRVEVSNDYPGDISGLSVTLGSLTVPVTRALAVGDVPELSTWHAMIVGVGSIGWRLRRRRRQSTAS